MTQYYFVTDIKNKSINLGKSFGKSKILLSNINVVPLITENHDSDVLEKVFDLESLMINGCHKKENLGLELGTSIVLYNLFERCSKLNENFAILFGEAKAQTDTDEFIIKYGNYLKYDVLHLGVGATSKDIEYESIFDDLFLVKSGKVLESLGFIITPDYCRKILSRFPIRSSNLLTCLGNNAVTMVISPGIISTTKKIRNVHKIRTDKIIDFDWPAVN